MKPRMLSIDTKVMELFDEIVHTHARLNAYPFLSAHAQIFEDLYQEWLGFLQQELQLEREHEDVEAQTIVVDDGLDFLATAISSTILASNGGNRKAEGYTRYFQQPPSKLKRPVLGRQLGTMRQWPPSLQHQDNPQALRDYGAKLAEQIPRGEAAAAALDESRRKRDDFRLQERKKFVDKLNAARHVLYGNLSEIPLKRPELGLSTAFARRFFKRSRRASNDQPTIAEVEKTLLRLGEETQHYEELLARLLEEEEAAAQAAEDAELVAARAELAELEAQRAEALARVQAMEARAASETES